MKFKKSLWTRKEQGQFLLHVGQLLERGYTLGNAFELVSIHHPRERRVKINEIIARLREGIPIHQVLSDYSFPNNVVGFLYFAERHGNLSFAFKESGKLLVKWSDLNKEFYKLIRYPLFLCLTTVIVFLFILRRLLPQFQNLYNSLDITLPLPTKIFIFMLQTAPILIFYLAVFFVSLSFLLLKRSKRYTPLDKMKLYLKIPILKTILRNFNTHYFAIQLSYLLKGGLSIFECLSLFEKQSYFKFLQLEVIELKRGLKEGNSFPSLLEKNPLFAQEFSMVVSHGLANGRLTIDLSEYCTFLVHSFEEKMKFYLSIIQPLLFSILGTIIFVMFLSILLPMFHLLNSL